MSIGRHWLLRHPVTLLLALTALFYWRLTFSGRFTFLDSPDLAGQVLPWYAVQARAWQSGEFPLWDPYVWYGQPLLGQMQPGAAFPFNWLLFLMPLDEGRVSLWAVGCAWALMHLLAAGFAYALARELGRSPFAALLTGLAFACGGYLSAVFWPQMLQGALWLPLTLLFFHRAARCGVSRAGFANAGLGGGSIGLSFLSGHHQAPFFSLLALTGLAAWLGSQGPRRRVIAALWTTSVAVGFLVGGLQLLPALEYGADAYRWVDGAETVAPGDDVSYDIHERNRLYPSTLLGLVVPRLHFQTRTFVGWVCLLLALYAVAECWRDRWTAVYALLALGGLAFCLGPFSLLHGWVYAFIPFAASARSAAHAVFIPQLAIFLLAARGADRLLFECESGSAEPSAFVWAQRILVGSGVLALYLVLSGTPEGRFEVDPGDQYVLFALFSFLLAACLAAYRRGALTVKAMQFALVAVLLSEMYAVQWFDIGDRADPDRQQYLGRLAELEPAARFLQQRQRSERFRFELLSDDLSLNVGAWYGLEQANGFLASVSRPLFDLHSRIGWREARLLLNTVYTVAKEQRESDQELVFADPQSGWNVYRNPGARPRAWLVPNRPACEGGEARLVSWRSQRLKAAVETPCDALLVFAEPLLPGWRAELDGARARIEAAHGALRAVAVPAGRHVVELVYRPGSVALGAGLTVFGLAVCAAAAVFARAKQDGNASEASA